MAIYHLIPCGKQNGKVPWVNWSQEESHIIVDCLWGSPIEDALRFWRNRGASPLTVGLILGSLSSNLIAIDIDGDGPMQQEFITSLQAINTVKPNWEFKTPHGYRFLFTDNLGLYPHKTFLVKATAEGHDEITILSNGSYTIIPPSVIAGPNGGSYEWQTYDEGNEGNEYEGPPDISTPIVAEAIFDLCAKYGAEEQTTHKISSELLFTQIVEKSPAPPSSKTTGAWHEGFRDNNTFEAASEICRDPINRAKGPEYCKELLYQTMLEHCGNNPLSRRETDVKIDYILSKEYAKDHAFEEERKANLKLVLNTMGIEDVEEAEEAEEIEDTGFSSGSNLVNLLRRRSESIKGEGEGEDEDEGPTTNSLATATRRKRGPKSQAGQLAEVPMYPVLAASFIRDMRRAENREFLYDSRIKTFYTVSRIKGPWQEGTPEESIRMSISSWLVKHNAPSSARDVKEVLEQFKQMTNIPEAKNFENTEADSFYRYNNIPYGSPGCILDPISYIILDNGVLLLDRPKRIKEDGEFTEAWKAYKPNHELVPWNPDIFHGKYAFDISYNPKADCPNFKRYLAQWLPHEGWRKTLIEYMGYCLVPDMQFRKSLFVHGPARTGKSRLLTFFRNMWNKMHASLSYDQLDHRFGPAELVNSLINVKDDTNITHVNDTGNIKSLTSGEEVDVERKYEQHKKMVNKCKLVFSANQLPKVSDKSEAWYDRWLFIEFACKIVEGSIDSISPQEIDDNYFVEKEGILNLLIEGYMRLLMQGKFTSTKLGLQKGATDQYQEENNSAFRFFNQYTRPLREDEDLQGIHPSRSIDIVHMRTAYADYKIWCQQEGEMAMKRLNMRKTFEENSSRFHHNLGGVHWDFLTDRKIDTEGELWQTYQNMFIIGRSPDDQPPTWEMRKTKKGE